MSNDPKMEKNYWLALGLSMLVLLAYPLLLKKTQPAHLPAEELKKDNFLKTAAIQAVLTPEKPKAETISFSNELYDIQFSTAGAAITEMVYKGEKIKAHLQVPLFVSGGEGVNFGAKITNQEIDLSRAVYQFKRLSENVFEFSYEKAGDFRFIKKFIIEKNAPIIQLAVTVENLTSIERYIPIELSYALHYADSTEPHHMGIESVFYLEKVKGEKLDKIRKKGFSVSGGVEWAGLVKKYFAVLVKPDWRILSQENQADETTLWASLRMDPLTVAPAAKAEKTVFVFAGPQRYEILKNLNMDFELILSRGFFGLFKIWLLIALKYLNGFVHNFGWAIILLTIGLKIVFTPLTHMSYESMRKMQAVQPKMKSIQERYKNDPTKMNREVMELYRRNKVNPMGGCLPMLAQIPIFIAFYQVLNETIELKGAPFAFWIHDLAAPDKLFMLPFTIPFFGNAFNLLPFFMAGSMFWQQSVTPQASTSKEQAQMMKFMPLMMGVILYSMPSGLALYWFINNMLTVAHQLIIKRMGDVILHHEDRD